MIGDNYYEDLIEDASNACIDCGAPFSEQLLKIDIVTLPGEPTLGMCGSCLHRLHDNNVGDMNVAVGKLFTKLSEYLKQYEDDQK